MAAQSVQLTPTSIEGIGVTISGTAAYASTSSDKTAPKNVIVIGSNINNNPAGNDHNATAYDQSIVIGYDIRNRNTGQAGDTIIGNRINLGGGGNDSFSTGMGYGVQVAGSAVSIGVGARADIGDPNGWDAVENGGVAVGNFASMGGNKKGGVAIGAIAEADQDGSVAIGQLSGVIREFFDRFATIDAGVGNLYSSDKGFPVTENNGDYLTSIGYKAGARGKMV